MLEFVAENKRDYQPQIISEVRTIDEVYSVTINLIFFHKSNYQNELVRLQRHNKFASELMYQMTLLGIEGPRKAQPGGAKDYPFYYVPVPPPSSNEQVQTGPFPSGGAVSVGGASPAIGPRNESISRDTGSLREVPSHSSLQTSSDQQRRRRAESRARQYESRVPDFGDVFEARKDPAAANLARLQSLREEAVANNESSSVDRLSPLDRSRTTDSNSVRKRGLFNRPRSATKEGRRSDAGASMV